MGSILFEMRELLAEAKVDLNQIVKLPRFEFIAEYLVMMTASKANRSYVQGYQVKKKGKKYQVLSTATHTDDGKPVVVMETDNTNKLFDYVRRGPLGYFTREADNIRVDALSKS